MVKVSYLSSKEEKEEEEEYGMISRRSIGSKTISPSSSIDTVLYNARLVYVCKNNA